MDIKAGGSPLDGLLLGPDGFEWKGSGSYRCGFVDLEGEGLPCLDRSCGACPPSPSPPFSVACGGARWPFDV